jgi:biopolymer transport protein ExbD
MGLIRRNDDNECDVQMTSFMDLVFLLLIFFIVTASLKKPEKVLNVVPPMATYAREAKLQNEVVITVTRDGEWYLNDNKKYFNQAPVDRGEMMTYLRTIAEADRNTPIRLDIDRKAEFYQVMPVVDNLAFYQLRNLYLKSQHDQADEKDAPKN